MSPAGTSASLREENIISVLLCNLPPIGFSSSIVYSGTVVYVCTIVYSGTLLLYYARFKKKKLL